MTMKREFLLCHQSHSSHESLRKRELTAALAASHFCKTKPPDYVTSQVVWTPGIICFGHLALPWKITRYTTQLLQRRSLWLYVIPLAFLSIDFCPWTYEQITWIIQAALGEHAVDLFACILAPQTRQDNDTCTLQRCRSTWISPLEGHSLHDAFTLSDNQFEL